MSLPADASVTARPAGAAHALIDATVDRGSFVSWDEQVDLTGLTSDYLETLAGARQKSGVDEAVLTGRAVVGGQPVALVVSEFAFLGGSIGRATGDRIVAAIHRATAERLPLVAAPASGGTRMQEGTPAFVRMVDISRAVIDHKSAGLPYLVYLRHPTTGGVFASWASLGQVLIAEPGALIGFLGPVVYQTLYGEPFPEGVQRAENLLSHGLVDAVVPAAELGGVLGPMLRLLGSAPRTLGPDLEPPVETVETVETVENGEPVELVETIKPLDAWSSVELTRRADRPGLRELLAHGAEQVIQLSGTQTGPGEESLLVALASLAGTPCVVVGQDRSVSAEHRHLGPAALRSAQRGMRLAGQLRMPLVCVIDTPGADLSVAAEEGGLAAEIARCLAELVSLTVPSVSVLVGEGTGGAALALLPAGRVIAAANAWLAPLPPEGASAILYRSTDRAPEMARRQRIRAADLLADGIAHAVVSEEPPAHEDPVGFSRRIAAECARQIASQR